MLAAIPAFCAAQAPILPNGFAESPQRSPQINDFMIGVKMKEQADNDPAFAAKLTIYRACSEAALRTLPQYKIDPQSAMIYDAVRQCTRTLHNYVLMFGADPRFKANQYVGHAIMRMTQQDEMDVLRPLAAQLQPFNR